MKFHVTWKQILASVTLCALIAVVVLFRARMGADLWPPDRSFVGPNIVAALLQWSFFVIIVGLVWHPVKAFFYDKLSQLHNRHDEHAEHLEHIASLLQELQAGSNDPTVRLLEETELIKDLLDEKTPGGLRAVIDRLDEVLNEVRR